jgi:hypothetical protein
MSPTINAQLSNPFAPPCYNGLNPCAPEGYIDVDFSYVFDVTLTALQVLLNQVTPTTNDADFVWRAMIIAFSTGAFNVRFYDSQGYALSNGLVTSANIVGDASSPYPLWPELIIPAGGKIGIDLQDISGNTNVIEIVFRGVKRYRIAGLPGSTVQGQPA